MRLSASLGLIFSLQDDSLRAAHALYGSQWKLVAAHVGHEKDRTQCQHRWAVYLDPQRSNAQHRTGPWTEQEVRLIESLQSLLTLISFGNRQVAHLSQLVATHRNVRNGLDSSTNWAAVAGALGREYTECRNKWKVVSAPKGELM